MNIDVDKIAELLFGSESRNEYSTKKAFSLILCAIADFKKTYEVGEEGLNLELTRSFSAPFAARYLDRFLVFLQTKLQKTFDVEFEMRLAAMVLDTPYFDKWVREVHSKTLGSFFRTFVKLSAQSGMFPDLTRVLQYFRTDPKKPVPEHLLDRFKMIADLYNIPRDILLQLPKPPPLPDFTTSPVLLPSPERAEVAAELQVFWNDLSYVADLEEVKGPFGDYLLELKARGRGIEAFVAFLNEPESWKESKSQFEGHGRRGFISWISCEAKDGVKSGCSVLKKGEEMKVCGKVVRYCSEDHQRAHWKTHKKTCFAVEWGPLDP